MGCILYELAVGTRLFASDSEVVRYSLSNAAVNVTLDDSFDHDTKHKLSGLIYQIIQIKPLSW
jgi:hypothetical protein